MRKRWGLGLLLVAACRVEPAPPPGEAETESTQAQGGARPEPPAAAPSATASQPSEPRAGQPAASASAGGAPNDAPDVDDCGGQNVSLEQIHAGRVRAGVSVSVGALVASSQKFLVSEAKSGSCLWGAFAAGQGLRGAGSGLFVVSFGAPHADGEPCQPGSDGLPDDLRIGDVLRVSGKLDDYVPAACASVAPAQQLVLDAACPARRSGRAEAPEAELIDVDLADRLAAGNDADLMREWGGALVRLEGVSARQDEDGDAVFPFGAVRLAETSLEVHSRLYYFDLSQGGPRAASKGPRYPYPTAFGSVTGLVFLDYCSWVLAPRDRCVDLAPASEGCTASAVGP